MYTMNDSDWERRQRLQRNTDRLKALMPAFKKVGFPEFNVRRDNDVIHTPHGQIIVGVWFTHHPNVAMGCMSICRLPADAEGRITLNAWLAGRSAHAKDSPGHVDYTVKLASRFGYVECDLSASVHTKGWEKRFAKRMMELANLYTANPSM